MLTLVSSHRLGLLVTWTQVQAHHPLGHLNTQETLAYRLNVSFEVKIAAGLPLNILCVCFQYFVTDEDNRLSSVFESDNQKPIPVSEIISRGL